MKSYVSAVSGALLLLGTLPGTIAELKISSGDEIITSSSKLAKDLFTLYDGDKPGKAPGILPGPPPYGGGDYYYIQGAGFWQTYIDYQHLTGDDSFQDSILKGLAHQIGPNDNYLPPNSTLEAGNDGQCFWGSAALQAAEYQLPNYDGRASWIELAKNVWTEQSSDLRQDGTCGGGLRWQFASFIEGYDWKQATANACHLTMGARLARFTGNATYAEHSEKTWDWLSNVGLIDNKTMAVYDGTSVEKNCTNINKAQWSMNVASLVEGAAFMYNFTNGSDIWRDRTQKLTDSLLKTFFPKGIAYEVACEKKKGVCPVDALFMKGYVHRWLAVATQVAPFLSEKVLPVLKTSAEAAAKQCKDSDNGTTTCGFYWSDSKFVDPRTADDTTGVGEGTSVLSAISSLLINDAKVPFTEKDEGSSNGGSGGSGSGGSATGTGTAGPASPTESPSGGGRFAVDMKLSLLVGTMAAFAWAI
ncbi:hypothetical protein CkaCkLH20_08584 [Colletotrichum karsti]|uniref:Mannan endo-1,6-alpha-mannosidase n=1 Tax=Colletotrichum karsti TaxID=1095194 RepID=A0A9P6I888_9PEZI|nr:uncharacterized protein CkaCkLH20_08584 [Colletotrichum karsti]KAF9873850.1 hypothetical protein CkaCkLH20_08584 [Colletotrichum karsti]